MNVIWHDTPEAAICAMYDGQVTPEELADCVLDGESTEGEAAQMSLADMADHIRENRYWGFVLTEKDEMHLWAEPDVDPSELLYLIGHEIGHTLGTPLPDPVAEEDRADTYGAAAALAWRIVSERKNGAYQAQEPRDGEMIILAD